MKILRKAGSILLIPIFFGCDTADDVGIQYSLNTDIDAQLIEVTLPVSNIYTDSLRTDAIDQILVGKYSDEQLGAATAEGYLSMRYLSGTLPGDTIGDEYIFQSLRMSFLTQNYINDGSDSVYNNFEIYELDEPLSDLVYLSGNKQSYSNLVGSTTISSNRLDTIFYNFSLADSFSNRFYSQLKELTNLNDLRSNGFALTSTNANTMNNIRLDNDTTRLFMYVKHEDPDNDSTTFGDTTYVAQFVLASPSYSYIDRNRTGTTIAPIQNNETFKLDNGKTFIDPLLGISTSIDITPIIDFFDSLSINGSPNLIINSSLLVFDPDQDISRDTLTSFYQLFRKNDGSINPSGLLTNPFSNAIMTDNSYLNPLGTQTLSESFLNSERTQIYAVNTLFLQSLYRDYLRSDALVLTNPASNSEVVDISEIVTLSTASLDLSRLSIKKDGIKLRFYYTIFD